MDMMRYYCNRIWIYPSIVTRFWIITITLVLVIYLFDLVEITFILPFTSFSVYSNISKGNFNNPVKGYLINTPGCRIPDMDPFDINVAKFIFKPNKTLCYKDKPPLIESNLTSLYYNELNFPIYHIENVKNLNCCYKELYRKQPVSEEYDNSIMYRKPCIHFNKSVNIDHREFIQVSCKYNNTVEIYKDYFAFVPIKKPKLFQTINHQSKKLNVLVIGMDAVSRMNLHRQLPISYQYLTDDLHAIELLGYNKVADNTFVNLIPVLTGYFEEELQTICWLHSKSRFDNCPFLWNSYADKGYLTAFGEDCAWMGIFNYEKYGFKKQPTDYFYNTFNRHVEDDIGNDKDFNCNMCLGSRTNYNVTLEYIKKFSEKMHLESAPYFAFFWSSSLSHDYLNYPSLGDTTYYNFFKNMNETGKLTNTVLIFMSDHGIRWGDIRSTYQGQLEERLPFLLIKLPEWFKNKYPIASANLRQNTKKLTTPFDLHETFKDLLDVDTTLVYEKKMNGSRSRRSYSLFENIPINRTCEHAEIPAHWCTCQQSIPIPINSTTVNAAAHYIVQEINEQLQGYAQCATLMLYKILNAQLLYHKGNEILHVKAFTDYTVTLMTTPGEAIFEATVRSLNHDSTKGMSDEYYSLTGTISRLNLYGKQSSCITDFHLKLYCLCENNIK